MSNHLGKYMLGRADAWKFVNKGMLVVRENMPPSETDAYMAGYRSMVLELSLHNALMLEDPTPGPMTAELARWETAGTVARQCYRIATNS